MTRRIELPEIAGPVGRLEALFEAPHDSEPWCAAVVCHPHPQYGGTLHNKVVYRLARGLRHAGVAVLRFNYRGVGRSQGEYGNLEGEIEDARAALAWLRARHAGMPYGLAGFSFGARVITRLGCATGGSRFLLAAGFPTAMGGTEYLEHCPIEKIFLQGTHDQYGPRADLEAAYARWAAPKQIVWIEAADHFFAGALDALEARVTAEIEAVRGHGLI